MAQAVLYVELVPTTTGIKRNVEKELNGSFDTVDKKGSSVFSKIGGMAAAAGVAVAAAAATLAGIAIKGGFSRMLKIEDAQAKLTGLGHSAETITTIMGSALASVKGTAFGLDDAATLAATAVAAGIKPGIELEKYLRLTADAATIAGGSLSDLGSVMNNVTTVGAAYNDSLQILAGKGLPIYQWLADELGVTTAAVKDLASEGKISAETFRAAIEKNISGAALEAGATTRGAFANMMAALSRVGVALIEDVFPYFKTTFQGITGLLDDLTTKLGPIGDIVAEKIKPVADAIGSAFGSMGGVVSGVMSTLGPLIAPLGLLAAGALAPLLSGLPLIGKFLPVISGPIGLIAGAIAALIAVSPELRASLGGAFEGIVGAIGGVMTQLAPVFDQLVPVIMSLAGTLGGVLGSAISTLLPFVVQIITLFGGLLAQVLPMLIPILSTLGEILGTVFAAVLPIVVALLEPLMSIFEALIPVILAIVSAVMPLVAVLLEALAPILEIVAAIIAAVLVPVIQILAGIIKVLADIIVWLVENIVVPYIQNILVPMWEALGAAFKWVYENIIKPVFEFFAKSVTTTVDGAVMAFGILGGFFSGLWAGIQTGFKAFINFIIGGINGFIGGLNEVGSFISDITGGAVDIKIGKLPRLANGALVEASFGGSAAIIGEGRYDEAVLPLGGPQLEKIRDALGGVGGGSGDRPIYADGIGLIGWIREVAGQQAQLIFNTQISRAYATGR